MFLYKTKIGKRYMHENIKNLEKKPQSNPMRSIPKNTRLALDWEILERKKCLCYVNLWK